MMTLSLPSLIPHKKTDSEEYSMEKNPKKMGILLVSIFSKEKVFGNPLHRMLFMC